MIKSKKTLELVIKNLLSIHRINTNDVFSLLENMHNAEYSDFYFQMFHRESWNIERRLITHGSSRIEKGVGIRAIQNDKIGFTHSDQLDFDTLAQQARIANNIIDKRKPRVIRPLFSTLYNSYYSSKNPVLSSSSEEKTDLLYRIDRSARRFDKRVKEVSAYLCNEYEEILVIASDGTLAADIRPMTYLSVVVYVEQDGKREKGSAGMGGRVKYNTFFPPQCNKNVNVLIKKSVYSALKNLESVEAPAGKMPVILGPGWSGILLHEAVGHGLEADFNRIKTSAFSNKIGQRVASNLCTIVDDSTIRGKRGSLSIDDEGVPGQYTILIKNGILKQYMQDKFNARLMRTVSTGNGRRQSYAHLPIPRMTNTYMLPGTSDPEDIICSTRYGIYASGFSGGQVDITSGQFVFTTSEAFLIQDGKIKNPIKNVTLIGSGTEVMKKISMVGNDFSLDQGTGTCGKEGQMVPVSVGQPTVKVESITVGGTQ